MNKQALTQEEIQKRAKKTLSDQFGEWENLSSYEDFKLRNSWPELLVFLSMIVSALLLTGIFITVLFNFLKNPGTGGGFVVIILMSIVFMLSLSIITYLVKWLLEKFYLIPHWEKKLAEWKTDVVASTKHNMKVLSGEFIANNFHFFEHALKKDERSRSNNKGSDLLLELRLKKETYEVTKERRDLPIEIVQLVCSAQIAMTELLANAEKGSDPNFALRDVAADLNSKLLILKSEINNRLGEVL